MSKLELVTEAPRVDMEEIINRARAVDLLRETVRALGPTGERWMKDGARRGEKRCLAQTMFDIAGCPDDLSVWDNCPHLYKAGLAVAECANVDGAFVYHRHDDSLVPHVVEFNDHPETNFDRISRALDAAIAKLIGNI